LDFQAIEKYIKSTVCIEAEHVELPRLSQSKLYLKIIGILYLSEHTNTHITLDDVERILKSNYIFNDIFLASKSRIIKVSPKSDMSIIWIDIWDTQSRSKAKSLINRRFNVGSFIVTIHGANMNPGIPQCKNCWKWGHSTSVCKIQGTKCVKYNGPHQTIHHHEFVWCCKANDKTNPPRLETKKGKLCLHFFKCSNCKGEHQADLTDCPFWKYYFNKEWYSKEYVKLQEN